jgi:hypothetical protein
MTRRSIQVLFVTLSLAMVTATGAWLHSRLALQASRASVVAHELEPMGALLRENRQLITELQTAAFSEQDAGILESYLLKIRRDGVSKNAEMKQRLDTLAENNTALVTLITAYLPDARTAAFTAEAEKYRRYAIAWRDRWDSVMELFMAGGNFAAAGLPYPEEFAAVVQGETAAVR